MSQLMNKKQPSDPPLSYALYSTTPIPAFASNSPPSPPSKAVSMCETDHHYTLQSPSLQPIQLSENLHIFYGML